MQIIHIISTLTKINFGIWNAAIFASGKLHDQYRFSTLLWVCSDAEPLPEISIPITFIGKKEINDDRIQTLISQFSANPLNTIFVTHGAWGSQTPLGVKLKKKGFTWIYTPHGMLEPWSMKQKKWKKLIYFSLYEKGMARQASAIRAVGKVEQSHLQKIFTNESWVIENGVKVQELPIKSTTALVFLFMARLHFKKGIIPLVKAWNEVMKDSTAKLIIAGPDEAELDNLKPLLNDSVKYVGAVYGEEKENLLRQAHYYVLPSFSEGFPTSVVEAMSFGAIPLISTGCNFPEVFSENLGYNIEPNHESITEVLRQLKNVPFDVSVSEKNHTYVKQNLSEDRIAEKLMRMYNKLLGGVNLHV